MEPVGHHGEQPGEAAQHDAERPADLRAAVIAVAPDGDPDLWPVPAEAADQAAQVTAHLGT